MKNLFISIGILVAVVSFASCSSAKKTTNAAETAQKEMEVSGEIVKIENGKDGYMATVKDKEAKSYIVTISIVNLQKSGATYKRFEVGQKIWAKGSSWKDEAGNTYITAKDVKAAP